jgi:hypothetical protein
MPKNFVLADFLQENQAISFPDIEAINFTEFLFLSTMIFAMIWFICISVSAVASSADAFRGLIERRLHPEKFKEMAKGDSIRDSLRDSFRGSFSSTAQFFNDLEPPFAVNMHKTEGSDDIINCPDVTHFLFLVHGHRGQSKDLAYMQTMIQKVAAVEKKRKLYSSPSNNGSQNASLASSEKCQVRQDMVVHSAVCNEHTTKDGIRNGGDRLVKEMLEVIEAEMTKRQPEPSSDGVIYDITISILGNSLGGLYGRYAIAKLVERHCVKESKEEDACWIVDGKYRLHLNVFCTTATPHLGVSKHTYLPLPRSAEIAAAHAMRDTGKDLFRLNDLLHTMATCPTFLEPLANFRKRIAYANAFGTDFPVPTATAAFLSENSSYPHLFVDEESTAVVSTTIEEGFRSRKRKSTEESSDDSDELAHNKLFVASLHTHRAHTETNSTGRSKVAKRRESNSSSTQDYDDGESGRQSEHKDELHHMSESLDKLGWKKVFIDIRSELITIELPKSFRKRRLSLSDVDVTADDPNCIHALKKRKKSLPSKDLASAVGLPNDNRVSWPLGHNMIVAFSRSRMSTFMNKGGRPVVNAVAKELVEDIFAWDVPSTNTSEKPIGDGIEQK